jgi:hypothetical protein
MEEFLENDSFYWYHKYLPLANVSELYALRNTISAYLESGTQATNTRANSAFEERIHNLREYALAGIQAERNKKQEKMDELVELQGNNPEVRRVRGQFTSFKEAVDSKTFPANDVCLDEIEDLHSELIKWPKYANTNSSGRNQYYTGNTYKVLFGDYFRKIAQKIWGNEEFWRCIYFSNRNNGDLLPNRENPNLILPNVTISIPQKPCTGQHHSCY